MQYTKLEEDNKNYLVVDEIRDGDNIYVYLSNLEDNNNFHIKKVVDNYLEDFDTEEEYNKAQLLFVKKYEPAFEFEQRSRWEKSYYYIVIFGRIK